MKLFECEKRYGELTDAKEHVDQIKKSLNEKREEAFSDEAKSIYGNLIDALDNASASLELLCEDLDENLPYYIEQEIHCYRYHENRD